MSTPINFTAQELVEQLRLYRGDLIVEIEIVDDAELTIARGTTMHIGPDPVNNRLVLTAKASDDEECE